jgi:phage host-nuclease inhibitor protein Gam
MRIKPQAIVIAMKNLEDVNEALKQIGDLQRRIRVMNDEMNKEFTRVTAGTDAAIAPLMMQIQAYEGGMKVFAETNREAVFGKGKTRKLDYGEISYRQSTSIIAGKVTLALLEDGGYEEAIRIKKSVNKDELENWTDGELKLVKARRKIEDIFGYKLKEEAIKDKKLVA